MMNTLGSDNTLAGLGRQRIKTATDATCSAEVSNDLPTWGSGATGPVLHLIEDLGPLEGVTYRDAQPNVPVSRRTARGHCRGSTLPSDGATVLCT